MRVQFNVVVFATPSTRVVVVGSHPALGEWQLGRAIHLAPMVPPPSDLCPSYFSGMVEIPDIQCVPQQQLGTDERELRFTNPTLAIQYKFVRWEVDGPAERGDALAPPPVPAATHLTSEGFLYSRNDLQLPQVSETVSQAYSTVLPPPHTVLWEGSGSKDNRTIQVVVGDAGGFDDLTHVMDPANILCNGPAIYYALPTADFLEPGLALTGQSAELVHTTRYYNRVKQLRAIHFNQILPRIYCGSCPRRLEHLDLLKKYSVGAIFNLQSPEDLRNNWIDEAGFPDPTTRTSLALHAIYAKHDLQLVHIPTEDMNTEARAAMMAQAAWLLAGFLVASPDRNVYVHCNAGVGRAVACCCAFLHFCLGLSEVTTKLLMRRKRPVAYLDTVAIQAGKLDFDRKFAKAALCLPLVVGTTLDNRSAHGFSGNPKDVQR